MKDIALIISPIITLIISIATIIYNVFDRNRHYAIEGEKLKIEREKIAREMTRALLSGSATLERKADLYGQIMKLISDISKIALDFGQSTRDDIRQSWVHEDLKSKVDEILELVRSSQSLTNKVIHSSVTRIYTIEVIKVSSIIKSNIKNGRPIDRQISLNGCVKIISMGDSLKDQLRGDLESFILGIERSAIDHPSR